MLKSRILYVNVKSLVSPRLQRFSSFKQPGDSDHYKTLGVSANASLDQIKDAYRKLSKEHHPDVSKDPNSVEKFKKINNAYTVLKDEKARSQYDMSSGRSYDHPSSKTAKHTARKEQASTSYSSAKQESEHTSSASSAKAEASSAGKSEEELLYESIFGKSFKEDPLYYYKAENEELRRKYQEELEKLRKNRGDTAEDAQGGSRAGAYQRSHEESAEWQEFMRDFAQKNGRGPTGSAEYAANYQEEVFKRNVLPNWMRLGLTLSSAMIIYFLTIERSRLTEKYETASKYLKDDEIDTIRQNHLKKREEEKEKKKAEFTANLALMKKYPRRNPTATNMLVDYTIWNDVKTYFVMWTYFHGEDQELLDQNKFEKSRLYNTKMNTRLTLALEMERIFKNVYVKVDDVVDSLKKTGHYEPPGIFFRYFGFIHAKIRRKPIIAENLQEAIKNKDKTISLHNLFFRYSTPILIANNEYYEIPLQHMKYVKDTTTKEGTSWIGNAYINFRPIEKKVVSADEKNVWMWRGPSPPSSVHERYGRAWGYFYQEYKKI